MKTAIILGGTGLTGGMFVNLLVKDENDGLVKVFGRRPMRQKVPKLWEYREDLHKLQEVRRDFTGDVVFCCIGTTKRKTPDPHEFRRIVYGIPVIPASQVESYSPVSGNFCIRGG